MRLRLATLFAVVLVMTWRAAIGAMAGDYPVRPVKILIAFPPGSALDAVARVVADELGKTWHEGVIVESVVGGSGNVGTERFSRSEPDGYTLLASPPGPVTFNKLIFKDIHYDAKTFAPISVMAKVSNVLLVPNDFPAKDAREWLALVKANPGKFTFASQGLSSTGYLTEQLFEARTGASMVHVPYRGMALALADVVAGHVDGVFDVITTSLPLHKGGQARLLAVLDDERSPLAPDIPTLSEAGVPGFHSLTWFALMAPPGTPADLVQRINADLTTIIRRPDVDTRLRGMMLTPVGNSPAQAGAFLSQENAVWSKLITDIGLKDE